MLRAALKFARIRIVATCLALVLLGSIAAGGLDQLAVVALLLVVLVNIHANSINDYADRHIDKLNLKDPGDRPLVSGDISMRQFWWLHGISAAAVLSLSFFYGFVGVVGSLLVLLVDYAYSVRPARLAARPLLGPLTLAGAYVFYSFTFGYLSYPEAGPYPMLLAVGLYLGFIARLLLKDFRDIEGDKKYGKITFLIHYGKVATVIVSGALFAAAMLTVSWSLDLYYSVTTVLLLCSGLAVWFLWRLFGATEINSQHYSVIHVARLANIAIIITTVYLLCRNQQLDEMTTHAAIFILGGALSGRALLDYSLTKPAGS